MATWTKTTKWLWLGRSGLQYTETITCNLASSEAKRRITEYFTSKGGVLTEDSADRLQFKRGSPWALLLGVSERQLPQDISLSFVDGSSRIAVTISYDLRRCWTIAVAPSILEKEVTELQTTLKE